MEMQSLKGKFKGWQNYFRTVICQIYTKYTNHERLIILCPCHVHIFECGHLFQYIKMKKGLQLKHQQTDKIQYSQKVHWV